MKKIYAVCFLMFILFCSSYAVYAWKPESKEINQDEKQISLTETSKAEIKLPEQTSTTSPQPVINIQLPETLQIKNVSEKMNGGIFCERNMPWIVALLAVLTTMLNVWLTTKLSRKQFMATLGTKNRQDWINDLRNCISEFLSIGSAVSLMRVQKQDYNASYFEKLLLNKFKIQLFLNSNRDDQKKLLEAVVKFTGVVTKDAESFNFDEYHKIKDEIIDASRKLFQNHWEKIKQLK